MTTLAGLTIQTCIFFDTLSPQGLRDIGAMAMKFLSYFTIVTNLLILGSQGALLVAPLSHLGRLVSRPSFSSGLMLYIGLVGSLYALLLAPFWHPQGWQKGANVILHYATPLLYLAFWIFFAPKAWLRWRLALNWLLYPALYLVWILGRGALVHDYPYFFMNPKLLGYARLLANAAGLSLVFLAAGLAVIGLNRLLIRLGHSGQGHAGNSQPFA